MMQVRKNRKNEGKNGKYSMDTFFIDEFKDEFKVQSALSHGALNTKKDCFA